MFSEKPQIAHVLYVFFALFFATEGWGLRVFHTNILGGNIFVVSAMVHILCGLIWFNNGKMEKLWPWFLILIGVFLSIYPAAYFWNQSFQDSFLLYRHHIWLFYLLVFCKIRPSQRDIYRAIGIFTIVFSVIWVYQAVTHNLLVTYYDEGLEDGRYINVLDNEIGFFVNGFAIVLVLFYHYLAECLENRSMKSLLIMLLLFLLLLLATRRSYLFFAALMLGYVIIKRVRQPGKALSNVVVFLIIGIGLYYSLSLWDSLVTETQDQMGDDEYARWRSVNYFFNEFSPSLICKIFGNGFLSLKTAGGRMIQEMSSYNIYIQDIGLMGEWVKYGIIPIIVIYYILFQILFFNRKRYPLEIKFLALHIAVLPTAWSLLDSYREFVLIFLLYQYVIIESKTFQNERVFS